MKRAYYEQEQTVARMTDWYKAEKETAFLEPLAKWVTRGVWVEVGGGAGLHGSIVRSTGCPRYVHSDLSYSLCQTARSLGLRTIQTDGLQMPLRSEGVDGIIAIGPSTIIGSQETRADQFREFRRVLKPGGHLILSSGRLVRRSGQHCLNAEDIQLLKPEFLLLEVYFWGTIPGRWWNARNRDLYRRVERLLSRLKIGARKVAVLEKVASCHQPEGSGRLSSA